MPYTPHPDVNETLSALLDGVRSVLKSDFIGLYLYGSLATGDFDPETSDIDFCVVTRGPPDRRIVSALHQSLWSGDHHWAEKLEGAYVDHIQIRSESAERVEVPCVNEGRFYLSHLGSDWIIQRHLIRESSLIISGPDPKTLIDSVSPDALKGSVRSYLHDWWLPILDNSARLEDSAYQVYAVLSMCRARYTLNFGRIASKQQSAEWLASFDVQWRDLIGKALKWHPGHPMTSLQETRNLIRSTIASTKSGKDHSLKKKAAPDLFG